MSRLALLGAGPSAAGQLDPLSLSPIVWYKADAGLLDGSDAPITVDGTAVKTWQDQSGNGRHLIQGTGAAQPLYKTNIVGGKPVVRFDGVDDYLEALFAMATPVTVLAVVKLAFMGAPLNKYLWDGGTQQNLVAYQTTAYSLRMWQNNTDGPIVALGNTNFHVVSCHYAGASSKIHLDGAAAVSAATGAGTATGGLTLAASASAIGHGAIDFAELMILSGSASDAVRDDVEAYFASRFGLAVA